MYFFVRCEGSEHRPICKKGYAWACCKLKGYCFESYHALKLLVPNAMDRPEPGDVRTVSLRV
jgi:hypothetical protein